MPIYENLRASKFKGDNFESNLQYLEKTELYSGFKKQYYPTGFFSNEQFRKNKDLKFTTKILTNIDEL